LKLEVFTLKTSRESEKFEIFRIPSVFCLIMKIGSWEPPFFRRIEEKRSFPFISTLSLKRVSQMITFDSQVLKGVEKEYFGEATDFYESQLGNKDAKIRVPGVDPPPRRVTPFHVNLLSKAFKKGRSVFFG